ncbi:MAG: N-6 DNA methylase [Deltaproteobacteria bacterium]|nr:N-6 DNA methylase [Deltaproteobacteria bacterium]
MPRRSAPPRPSDRDDAPRDLPRLERLLAGIRAETAARAPSGRWIRSPAWWRARVDLALLDAVLAAYLRASGSKGWARRSTELLGLTTLTAPGAPAPLVPGTPERRALDEVLDGAPWLEWGARGLDELVRDFGIEHDRNALGKFYTPQAFIEHILDHTLDRALETTSIEELRVLEPSCGSGDFAVPLLDRLAAAWVEHGADPLTARRHTLERNLFAIDWDPIAVVVTRIRLLAHAIDAYREAGDLPAPRVLHENALWDAVEAPALGPTTLDLPLGERGRRGPPRLDDAGGLLASRSPFHVIVGNPPYGAHLEAGEKRWLRSRYRLASGRFDTAALFAERSLELLAKGGHLGFVMPHSLVRSGAYAPARRMLTTRLALTTLVDLGNAFPGVAFNTMIFTGTSGRAGKRVEVFRAEAGRLTRTARIPRAFVASHETLPLGVREEDVELYAGIEARGQPLRALVRNERGLNLPSRRARLGKHLADDSVPVVRGRDLTPFGIVDPALLPRVAASDAATAVLAAPAIGIQNVSNVIEATMVPSGVLPLDTVNVLTPRDDRIDPFYLMALLNSSLLAAYLRDVVISHATLTVHLDDPTLGSLPIVLPPSDAARLEVDRRVRALLGLTGAAPEGEARAALRAELDAMVAAIYGVSSERAARLLPGAAAHAPPPRAARGARAGTRHPPNAARAKRPSPKAR